MFDEIIKRNFNNTIIEYGIFNGNKTILLIKTGSEGTIYGYNNKYLELAKYVSSKYGFTVIVSSNPRTGINSNQLADAIELIDEYFKDKYEIYYMGISNGGLIGAWYGNYYSFKRMLLINPPLMINYHKTKEGLQSFNNDKVSLIFGELDPSFKLVGLLDYINNDKVNYHIIKGEDHHLSNVDYKDLVKYLFDNE